MRFLILLLFSVLPFLAQAAEPVRLSYAVYGGGLHVVNARITIDESAKGKFDTRVTAATQGMLANIAPWSARMRSTGLAGSNAWTPRQHEFTTLWRNDAKTYEMEYDGKGNIIRRVVREQGKPDDTKPADPKLAAGAMDLPTGILNFLRHRTTEKGCEGQFAVYDGKRRFKAVLANQRDETIGKSRYSVFSGPAISCSVEIIQDGGEWSKTNKGWFKIQEDSRARGKLPRIMMTALPGVGGWLVPVRMDLASPWGAFVMHLTGAQGAVK